MARVAVAAGSQIAADAGAAAAANGGNAVDAAIAASLTSMTTDPGIIALGAGSYLTISSPDGVSTVIDAYAEMPGRAAPESLFGTGLDEVHMEYGGGTTTSIGHASVATPGSIAGFGLASEAYGSAEWYQLVEPSLYWAEQGFPLSGAAAEYLSYAHRAIFGWHPESYESLHHDDGTPLRAGETVRLAGLAHSLETLASGGPETFYTGSIGRRIADDSSGHGGLLGMEDLTAYEAVERAALQVTIDDWVIEANPGPAIGGATVVAFLSLIRDIGGWDPGNVTRISAALDAVLAFRVDHLDRADERGPAVDRLIELASGGDVSRLLSSPSTVHVSAVDEDGWACSISSSSGYGSGVVVPGTGIWLNNSLGETDLLRTELHSQGPGTRLPSNMAPTVARRADGTVLAIGSPGASRITSAVGEVLFNYLRLGMPLREAIAHPRLHVETFGGRRTLAHEPGVEVDQVTGMIVRAFDTLSMFFGGTHAAIWDPIDGLDAHADPRRTGGVAFGG